MQLLNPKKKWGQNFLKDPNIARKIISSIDICSPALIIEIGPGKGALTKWLLNNQEKYLGIEIDPLLADYLKTEFKDQSNFELLNKDFLKLDLIDVLQKYPNCTPVVIGNIPYNITSPILFKLLEYPHLFSQIILMVQKELGKRLTAKPGSKDYGRLTINAQLLAEIKYLFSVPAKLFFPIPKVDSAVVKLTLKQGVKEQFSDYPLFQKIVRHTFQHRRKMLRKSLSTLFSNTLLLNLKTDLTQRPEELSITEWQKLSESIYLELRKEPER